jgi:HEAT repeat protein
VSDLDRDLDTRLEALASHLGDLPGFESRVADAVRRVERDVGADRPPLEVLVGTSLRDAVRATGVVRRRRWIWSGAAAASLLAVVAVFWLVRSGRPVLASIGPGNSGFEVRAAGEEQWHRPPGRVRLGPGDEVRSVVNHTVTIQFKSGGNLLLHPDSRFRIDGGGGKARGRGVQAQLMYGGVDVDRAKTGQSVLVLRAGDTECQVDGARVQARRVPERGVVFTTYRGNVSLRTPDDRRLLRPGTAIFVAAGRKSRARVTSFQLDNRALTGLLADIRRRWGYYVQREARQQATGRVIVTVRLSPRARQLTDAKARSREPGSRVWVQRVPFPGATVKDTRDNSDIQEKARRFLAVHTEDDHRFVVDSLAESLKIGLPEIAGHAVAALTLMGEASETIEQRIEGATRTGSSHARRFARLAALAAAGQGAQGDVIRAALSPSRALRIRALAVLAVAGLRDTSLVKDVFFLAQGSASDLYQDWRASADFCGAVGLVFAGATDGIGSAYARDLVLDPSLPLKARRRYLNGFARELQDRPRPLHAFFLETFPRLTEDKLRRAVVMELLHARPVHRDAAVADFFQELAERQDPLSSLALNGLVLYAPPERKPAVEAWLLELLEQDAEAATRAAAAQAFAPLGARRAFASLRVVQTLEKALGDRDPDVRYWSARTLGVVGRRTSLPVVLEAARTETDFRCLAALAQTLVRLPGSANDPEVARFLARRTGEDLPPHVGSAFVHALGSLGTDFSRLILEDLCNLAEDPEVRMAAGEALAIWHDNPGGNPR